MAAKKNPLADEAYKLYKQGIPLVEIASQLGKPAGTIRRWKSTYDWDGERSDKKSERSEKKRVNKQKVIDDGTKETLQNEDLTPEQQMFCIYYSRTFNATQSYLKAYGCTYESAMVRGCEMLRNIKVKEEINRLKELKRQQIVASEHDLVELNMRIAFSDISDYLSFGQEEQEVIGRLGPVMVKDENEKEVPLKQIVNTVRLKESHNVDTQLIQEVKEGRDGVSIKLADKNKAMEWLTKYFLMHPGDRYKAEFEKKKAEVKDNTADEILKNMQTLTEILNHPAENRRIEDYE